MKKFRKLLVLSFSALLTVGVIAGCNNEETPSESTSTPTSESLSAAPSTPVDPTDVPSEPEQPSDESEPETPSEPSESEPEVPSEPSESEPEVPSVSDSEPDQPSESDPSEPEPEVPTYNYAADYKVFFEDSYKDVASQMADFDLPTVQSTFDDNDNAITVNIAWELEVHEGGVEGAIVKGEAANGKQHFTVKYNPEVSNVETSFTITGTITDPNGHEETVTFNWTIPAFEFASFDEFAQLAADKSPDVVNVKGHVTAIYKTGLYFADAENDGFYAYSPTGFAAADYKVGDEILVSGTAALYNGQYEFNKGCTVTKLNAAAEDHAPVYTDITETVAAAESVTDAILNQYQNALVEIKGATVDIADVSGGGQSLYYYFTLGNVRTYLRPYDGWINPDTGANYTLEEINALFTEWNKGYTADLKGLLSIYGGKYYLSLVDNDAITYTSKELADDVKAANAAEIAANNFKDTYVMGHTFDLPATGQADAALSYAITSEAAKIEDGKLVVTPTANDTTVSVNITATVNGEVGTYTTDFVVKGTEYTTIDAAKAVELASKLDGSKNETSTEWYYVSATVGEVYNTQYCNFYLPTADNDQALIVYGLWTGEDSGENRYGSNREIAEIPVKTGDTVTLYTKLQNYGGKLELVNAMLISVGTEEVPQPTVVEYELPSTVNVFTSESTEITLGEYAIAVDANGKVIYASAFAGGYGGPGDGFYHDGSYTLVPGQQCGIFNVDAEFKGWPATTEDGRNAWTLYSVVAPEGVTIYSGTAAEMLPVVNAIFDANLTELAGNAYLEGLTDGLVNDKVVKLTQAADEDDPVVTPTTSSSVDFNTIEVPGKPNGSSSYAGPYTTTSGWTVNNAAIQAGGTTDVNPQFTVIGPDNTYKAPCLNGKVSAVGTLTSPTLTGGLTKITMDYTKMFTDTKLSVTITVTDLATGTTYTHVVENLDLPSTEKYQVYTAEWVLETPIEGDFTIVVTNNCPSQATGNKDRITILSLEWE